MVVFNKNTAVIQIRLSTFYLCLKTKRCSHGCV